MSFLKVKRKCEEYPKEVLLLSKKHKLEESDDQYLPVFQLTSSAVKEEDINDIIAKTIKNHNDIKSPVSNLEKMRARMRKDHKEIHRNNRYQLYAAPRKLDDASLEQSVPVIDVLTNVLECGTEVDENQNECVYDLYYSSAHIDVTDPDFSSHHALLCDSMNDLDWEYEHESDDEVLPSDEDDSNDENNWRNDYPDEEDDSEDDNTDQSSADDSSNEDYLSKKLKKTLISSDYSLDSSDDENHEYHEAYDYCDEVVSGSDSYDDC